MISVQYYKNVKTLILRLNRLAFKLIEYDFEINHEPGSKMRVPESLSYYPNNLQVSKSEVQGEFIIHNIQTINIEQSKLADSYLFDIRQALLHPKCTDKAHRGASRLYVL